MDKAGFHRGSERPALLWAGFHAVSITVTPKLSVPCPDHVSLVTNKHSDEL